jgi:hypothetical protein
VAGDPSDPPRKFYDLKPKEFERVNAPVAGRSASSAPATPPSSPPVSPPTPRPLDSSKPIDVRELFREASTPGPVLSKGPRNDLNEVHAVLRDNLARANEAGLNEVPLRPKRPSWRKRDYILLMIGANAVLAFLAIGFFRSGNVIGFVSAMAGIGMLSASITWVMWFVMDDY